MTITDSINALAEQIGQYGGATPDGGIINGKPFGILDWARAGQERVEAACEALRKARATMDCDWGLCELLPEVNAVLAETFEAGYGGQSEHDQAASALLDGFSVDEVTAAEEVLA